MITEKKVLKIVGSVFTNENRDKRELKVAQALGADVLVMAKGETSGERENVDGFDVIRMSTRPLGNKIPNAVNRIVSLFTWASAARKMRPNVISGHDLIGVQIAWMSNWFLPKKKRAKIIYDSHEFTIFDYSHRNQSLMQEKMRTLYERFLISKCQKVVEVGDIIADEVQRIHKLKTRPIVVRNIPNNWVIDENIVAKNRAYLEQVFKFSTDKSDQNLILSYHGFIATGRGIEVLLNIIKDNPNVYLLLLGSLSEEYRRVIQNIIDTDGNADRVYIMPSVPVEDIYKWVGAADISCILLNGGEICKSYYYALPNKLFESIQSTTPLLCSNYPELVNICQKYDIGITVNHNDRKALNKEIDRIIKNKNILKEYKMNCLAAKTELCWENEKKILEELYNSLLMDDEILR